MTGNEFFGGWIVEKELGKGTYGKVFLAKKNGQSAAIKQIIIPNDSEYLRIKKNYIGNDKALLDTYAHEVKKIMNEIKILKGLSNEKDGIVKFYESSTLLYKERPGYIISICMEYLQPLKKHIEKNGITIGEVIKLGIQITSALNVCYGKNILHRDIKIENILVDENGKFKLSDFGESRKIEKGQFANTVVGTYDYMAPEIISNKTGYSFQADMYSLGILLYKLLNNQLNPFITNPKDSEDQINANNRRLKGDTFQNPQKGTEEIFEVIRKMCAKDPNDRFESYNELKNSLKEVYFNIGNKAKEYSIKSIKQNESISTSKDSIKFNSFNNSLHSKSQFQTNFENLNKQNYFNDFDIKTRIIDYNSIDQNNNNEIKPKRKVSNTLKFNKTLKYLSATFLSISLISIGVIIYNFTQNDTPQISKKIDTKVKDAKYSKDKNGNNINNGYVASNGEWIYYSNFSDSNKLYRRKMDLSTKEKITDYPVKNINIEKNFVYFVSGDDKKNIFKSSIDNKKTTSLNNVYSKNLNIDNNWIYYNNGDDQNKLYKITVEGKNNTCVSSHESLNINIDSEFIYYVLSPNNKNNSIWKVRSDGSDNEKIYDSGVSGLNIQNGWIYFESLIDNNCIYRINVDGTGFKRLTESQSKYNNAYGDWVYYSNLDDDGKIYKVSLNGEINEKFNNDNSGWINIVSNYLFYVNKEDNKLYKINLNGKEKKLID